MWLRTDWLRAENDEEEFGGVRIPVCYDPNLGVDESLTLHGSRMLFRCRLFLTALSSLLQGVGPRANWDSAEEFLLPVDF
ncbi:hypothetical protein ZIOFF_005532 [Zingiber officinale]|uniref:Uncharacterized protein n=1 Tax=Zingiber officinale TaxID=94328 RepID=A0A8J5HNJ4_ZINOF|nr:hypothetical protein ZIOFF_005532 [Zingiber officinale]